MEFAGLKALVTGGSSGIGASTALLLKERGADVAVLDLQPEQAGAGLTAIRCDVSDDAAVRRAVQEATRRGLNGFSPPPRTPPPSARRWKHASPPAGW